MMRRLFWICVAVVAVPGMAVLFLVWYWTSTETMARDFMEGKPTRKPVMFRFSSRPSEGVLVIKDPNEVDALTAVFKRNDTALWKVTSFSMEITFEGGRRYNYSIYTTVPIDKDKSDQMGFFVLYPMDWSDVFTKIVFVDPRQMPKSLLEKLTAFGLLPKQTEETKPL